MISLITIRITVMEVKGRIFFGEESAVIWGYWH